MSPEQQGSRTEQRPQDRPARLVVLESFPGRGPETNPYLLQLVDALGRHLDVRYFSWRTALTGRYDLFHVHWPERLLRSHRRSGRLVRKGLFVLLLLRLAVLRIPVVRTAHNETAHEGGGRFERIALRLFARRARMWIVLNRHTVLPVGVRRVLIPHGDYREWFASVSSTTPPVAGRALYFGLIRPYKGVDRLLEAFAAIPDPALSLHIAGKPSDAALEHRVRGLAAADPRVEALLTYVGDQALAREVSEASLVVLPYEEMHNSGAALLALSLNRPVLLPRSPVSVDLAAEVGSGWVQVYEGTLTADRLEQAIAESAHRPELPPALQGRDWATVAALHADAFTEVAGALSPLHNVGLDPDKAATR